MKDQGTKRYSRRRPDEGRVAGRQSQKQSKSPRPKVERSDQKHLCQKHDIPIL